MPGERLTADDFTRSPVDCARGLVGARFRWNGCSGRVVEVEAYAAEGDPACHTFSRPSARRFVATHPPGTAYVYLNYGVHWLFNVLVAGPEGAGFVLFRALEPLTGVAAMRRRRSQQDLRKLCSGPGKLTQALAIREEAHGREFLGSSRCGLWREDPGGGLQASPRIGISRARELEWRFTLRDSPFLSASVPGVSR